ncbi:MAG: DNA polymerase ligase N-terminal domain-containing protein [Solirubrobacteraceae bacterium]
MTNGPGEAVRIVAHCPRDPAPLLDAVLARAHDLALEGWVRAGEPEHLRAPGDARPAALHVHAEGDADGVTALVAFVRDAVGGPIDVEPVAVEGHEQFAVRGVIAGAFVVQEHQATAHHFDLRLQVGDVMRSWAVPKGPSLDPAVKRFAVAVGDHAIEHNDFEGREPAGARGAIVWDRGGYEQGGRVAWPQALERGHAVFVLHGFKLRGGFALQRTGAERSGKPAQWLLIKRRDAEARPGSEIVSERPESVLTGRTLQELLDN